MDPKGTMPWYFLVSTGDTADGYGVVTQPNAFCYWTVDEPGIDLWSDVRSGTMAVELGRRTAPHRGAARLDENSHAKHWKLDGNNETFSW